MVDLSWIHMTPSAKLKSVMFVNFNKTLMVDRYLVIILLLYGILITLKLSHPSPKILSISLNKLKTTKTIPTLPKKSQPFPETLQPSPPRNN